MHSLNVNLLPKLKKKTNIVQNHKMLTYFDKIDVEAVVRPRSEQHGAVLFVERKISHVDSTRAAEDDHRQPRHIAV